MKGKLLAVLALIGFVFTLYHLVEFFDPTLPKKVRSLNILKIAPGMSLVQVYEILGKPLSVHALNGIHTIGCSNPNSRFDETIGYSTDIKTLVHDFISKQNYCCEGNKRDLEEFKTITLVYTKRGLFFSYPMLWLHMDTSFKVTNVYAKEYESGLFGDDPGIYSCSWKMDSTYTKWDYAKTERSINKEKFLRCFK